MSSSTSSPDYPMAFEDSHDVDVASLRAHARAQGYAAGWAQGAKAAHSQVARQQQLWVNHQSELAHQGQQAVQAAVSALQRAAQQIQAQQAPAVQDILEEVLAAALDLSAAVLGHEPAAAEQPAADALRRALLAAGDERIIRIRMNPSDLALLEANDVAEYTLVADPAIARGDALVEHPLGAIEVFLQAAVERARAELFH